MPQIQHSSAIRKYKGTGNIHLEEDINGESIIKKIRHRCKNCKRWCNVIFIEEKNCKGLVTKVSNCCHEIIEKEFYVEVPQV